MFSPGNKSYVLFPSTVLSFEEAIPFTFISLTLFGRVSVYSVIFLLNVGDTSPLFVSIDVSVSSYFL